MSKKINTTKKAYTTPWNSLVSGLIGAIGGWLIVFCINISNQNFQQKIEKERQNYQNKIETVRLARDLNKEFYGSDLYHRTRSIIATCKDIKVFNKNLKPTEECSIHYDDLNTYLGFFDDLGYYEKE